MIYSCYFDGLMSNNPMTQDLNYGISEEQKVLKAKLRNCKLTHRQALTDYIKCSKGDSFVFITTIEQQTNYYKFLDDNGLREYQTFDLQRPFHNGNYPEDDARLFLHVLQSKE